MISYKSIEFHIIPYIIPLLLANTSGSTLPRPGDPRHRHRPGGPHGGGRPADGPGLLRAPATAAAGRGQEQRGTPGRRCRRWGHLEGDGMVGAGKCPKK
jgi:hypothetical protein